MKKSTGFICLGKGDLLELGRKLVHIVFGTFIFFVAYFYGAYSLAALCFIALLFGIPVALLIKSGVEFPIFSLAVELFGREREKLPGKGVFMFFAGAFLASLIAMFVNNSAIAYLALLPAILGDGLATIIGKRFGRHRIVKHKSVEGSTAFFFASFIALFLASNSLLAAFTVALLATVAEILPIDDNLILPPFSAVILYIIYFFNFL